MRARFSWLMSVVLATFVLAGSLTAQINTCNARGVVSDQNQNPVAGAAVEFQAIELGIKFVLHTNKKGEYFQLGVKPGFYNISVSAQGYGTYQMSTYLEMGSDFTNHVGNTNNDNVHNFVLPPAGKNIDDRAAATSNIRVFGNLGPTQDTRQEREAKRQRELQKENSDIQKRVAKVKGLNEKLLMASSAGKAGDWDQADQLSGHRAADALGHQAVEPLSGLQRLLARLGPAEHPRCSHRDRSGDTVGALAGRRARRGGGAIQPARQRSALRQQRPLE